MDGEGKAASVPGRASTVARLVWPRFDYLVPMLLIETERKDGRWLAEVPALPGVRTYGATDVEARSRATALALHVIAERVEHGEALPRELSGMFQLA
jgi:predicted RNase H-like HicB family nuclease